MKWQSTNKTLNKFTVRWKTMLKSRLSWENQRRISPKNRQGSNKLLLSIKMRGNQKFQVNCWAQGQPNLWRTYLSTSNLTSVDLNKWNLNARKVLSHNKSKSKFSNSPLLNQIKQTRSRISISRINSSRSMTKSTKSRDLQLKVNLNWRNSKRINSTNRSNQTISQSLSLLKHNSLKQVLQWLIS